MKLLFSILFCLSLSIVAQARYIPTPEMAMSWGMGKDSRKWTPKYQDGGRDRIISEFTPEGQSIDAWKEMVAHQIDFTSLSLRDHFEGWKTMLHQADPEIQITEEKLSDGSILATYLSNKANEMSVRRFIKASDGIYMLAYHVRPELKNDVIWKLWSNIVATAELITNPEKRR